MIRGREQSEVHCPVSVERATDLTVLLALASSLAGDQSNRVLSFSRIDQRLLRREKEQDVRIGVFCVPLMCS